jgi:PIN domain nuclease of toxin-antitoxin system
MVILDAYPLIALLANERASDEVEELIRRSETAATAVNVAEASDVTQRLYRVSAELVEHELGLLLSEIQLLPVGLFEALEAARLHAEHYDRRKQALSLADCFLLAAAGPDDAVATTDPAVAEAARSEGIQVVPLPDSSGRRP